MPNAACFRPGVVLFARSNVLARSCLRLHDLQARWWSERASRDAGSPRRRDHHASRSGTCQPCEMQGRPRCRRIWQGSRAHRGYCGLREYSGPLLPGACLLPEAESACLNSGLGSRCPECAGFFRAWIMEKFLSAALAGSNTEVGKTQCDNYLVAVLLDEGQP